MPSCADEMVAPVVGDTNLFIHNFCISNPATLIPTPVHKIANKRGKRDINNICNCFVSPPNISCMRISVTPINKEIKERIHNKIINNTVIFLLFKNNPPNHIVSLT